MTIRPLLGALFCLASMGAVACAADIDALPYKAPPMGYSWTGFYVGGNFDADTGSFDPNTSTVFNPLGYFDPTGVPAINQLGPQIITPSAVIIRRYSSNSRWSGVMGWTSALTDSPRSAQRSMAVSASSNALAEIPSGHGVRDLGAVEIVLLGTGRTLRGPADELADAILASGIGL
jgi:hypothetical protein